MGTPRPGQVSEKQRSLPERRATPVERPHKTAQLIHRLLLAEPPSVAPPLGMSRGKQRGSMRTIISQFIAENPGCTQLAIIRHVRHPNSAGKDTYVATQLLTLLHQRRIRREDREDGPRYFAIG